MRKIQQQQKSINQNINNRFSLWLAESNRAFSIFALTSWSTTNHVVTQLTIWWIELVLTTIGILTHDATAKATIFGYAVQGFTGWTCIVFTGFLFFNENI